MKPDQLAPPSLEDAISKTGAAERLMRLMAAAQTLDDSDYLHWDKLRHKQPPDGMTVDDWWLALKIRRSIGALTFPELQSRAGKPLRVSQLTRIQATLPMLDKQLAGRIVTSEPGPDEAMREQIIASSLMEEAIHSSLFEGAASTREDAKEMLRTNRAPINRDERMILNNYRAMKHLREMSKADLTVADVMELHTILTDGTLSRPEAAGRMQEPGEGRVSIVDARMKRIVYDPPPAEQLPERMRRLVEFANEPDTVGGRYVHPVLRSILLHFQLACDHPFLDGNGRTSRALFYWSMLRRGYWMVEFLSISRLLYRQRKPYETAFVQTETDDQDGTYFVLQQLDVLERAVAELSDYVARKSRAQHRMRALLWERSDLNRRQLALLDHAMRHEDAVFTHTSHANSQRVSRISARKDLQQLEAAGLLRREQRGRTHVYLPTDQFRAEIEASRH